MLTMKMTHAQAQRHIHRIKVLSEQLYNLLSLESDLFLPSETLSSWRKERIQKLNEIKKLQKLLEDANFPVKKSFLS